MPGASVAVVCPSGLSGIGQDSMWDTFRGSYKTHTGREVADRLAAAELSAAFAGKLFLRPAIQFSSSTQRFHLADEGVAGSEPPEAADLVYVSSHGWLGGFMRGNDVEYERAGLERRYSPQSYFLVGKAAAAGAGFAGPRWIVLAQCSTLNSATWALWAKIFENSFPHVRGILAYEESAPAEAGASTLAREFVHKLRAGSPLLEAWITTNDKHGRKWAAIVHEYAQRDRLGDFGRFRSFANVKTTAKSGPYLGFLTTVRSGTRVTAAPPPFDLKLFFRYRGRLARVAADNLDTNSYLREEFEYRLEVQAPPDEELESVALEIINVRPTYRTQFGWDEIFRRLTTEDHSPIHRRRSRKIQITLRTPSRSFALEAVAGPLTNPGLEFHHSYFWFRAAVVLSSGARLRYDFKTTGLLFR